MRNSGLLFFPAFLLGSFAASAQDITEAYRLSNLTVQGTARSMGFGNALGSVGGDFSSLSVNPAGLGIYRSSEFTFTPSLRMNYTSSEYTGVSTSDNNTHFNINNFGLVLTHAPHGRHYDHHAWKAVSFAFGMNRTADFSNNYTYQGNNTTSSGSQVFESDANLNPKAVTENSNTLGATGYNAFLINRNSAGQYFTTVPVGQNLNQLKSAQQYGGVNEYLFSLGGNYKEKLMLGVTIGIPSINYHSNSTYAESLNDNNIATNPYSFSSFNYNQSLDVTGAGINAKIGAIYKINDIFRIGAAFHSPTYYSISDVSRSNLYVNNDSTAISSYNNNGAYARNRFDYNLTTPWKGVLSATILLNNFGFITADYEYVDYSTMQYMYPGGIDNAGNSFQQDQDVINQQIKKTYQATSNFRLGGEAKISKNFMVRLGFGYYGNAYTPYGESTATSYYTTQRIDVSGGLGFHFRHFFTDLALVHSMYQGFEQPYSINYSGVISGVQQTVPTAKIDYSLNNLALTMGVKF